MAGIHKIRFPKKPNLDQQLERIEKLRELSAALQYAEAQGWHHTAKHILYGLDRTILEYMAYYDIAEEDDIALIAGNEQRPGQHAEAFRILDHDTGEVGSLPPLP